MDLCELEADQLVEETPLETSRRLFKNEREKRGGGNGEGLTSFELKRNLCKKILEKKHNNCTNSEGFICVFSCVKVIYKAYIEMKSFRAAKISSLLLPTPIHG